MVQVNTNDIRLITQPIIDTRIKIDVYDERDMTHLEQWECGIISATFSISAESDVRRTASISCIPVKNQRIRLKKDSIIWINRVIKLQIGIRDLRTREFVYYKAGTYVFNNYGANFDATNNTITLSLSDMWINFDGSRNGQVGSAETISFPAYEENESGEVIKYNKIRDAIITILTQLGKLDINSLEIHEVGEFKGLYETNPDYLQYRDESRVQTLSGLEQTWDVIPYDQEFSCGDTIASMLTTFRDLYPNYEMFFDVDNNFVCQLIPSCNHDDIVFNSDFFDKIYISENTSVDLTTVRNVCEVWGQVLEVDYYSENCTYVSNCYSSTVDGYTDGYYSGDMLGIKIPSVNQAGASININGYGAIPILDENTEEPISENIMEANQVYVFKIKKKYIDGAQVTKAYLMGQWQPHALAVLTNGVGSNEDYTAQDGTVVKKYSKEYFQKIYNCNTVEFTVIEDSEFAIEELGLKASVNVGGEFDNIQSDSLALARAQYELYKLARLTNSITVTTLLCPFADVNIKVSYRRDDTKEINEYIVKNLSHDPANGTTTWTLMRFFPLYDKEDLKNGGTWEVASDYTWESVSNYTWEQIQTLQRKE